MIVDAVLDSAILKGKLTELVGLWPILGGDLIKDVSEFILPLLQPAHIIL